MKPLLGLAAATVLIAFSGCASDHLPSSVRTVSLAPAARQQPVVLAPAKANVFSRMAGERSTWAANQLRAAIAREIANGGRFQTQPTGSGSADAQIAIETLRHGVIEVSANNFAVTVSGTVSITHGAKNLGTREFSATSGDIRPLLDLEDPRNYEAALQGALDKAALELVADL